MSKKELKNPWLVQRGSMRDRDGKKGIDSILQFDYMGAAEFEWGALGESLERIRDNIDEYHGFMLVIGGKEVTVFAHKDIDPVDMLTYLNKMAYRNFRLKEGSHFDRFINDEMMSFMEINHWWDLDNDLMFWKKDDVFHDKFRGLIAG